MGPGFSRSYVLSGRAPVPAPVLVCCSAPHETWRNDAVPGSPIRSVRRRHPCPQQSPFRAGAHRTLICLRPPPGARCHCSRWQAPPPRCNWSPWQSPPGVFLLGVSPHHVATACVEVPAAFRSRAASPLVPLNVGARLGQAGLFSTGGCLQVVCEDALSVPEVDVLLSDAAPSSGMRALQVRLLAEEEAVPTGAAQYYLTETGGDVRAAKAMHRAPPSPEVLTPAALAAVQPRPARRPGRRGWWRLCGCADGAA